jgi:hypothetical protein
MSKHKLDGKALVRSLELTHIRFGLIYSYKSFDKQLQ